MQGIDFFYGILPLQEPWVVVKVKPDRQAQQVGVYVEHLEGTHFY